MTQPFTSDNRLLAAPFLSAQGKLATDKAEHSSYFPDSAQPAIVHPNFDPNKQPLDPARPLSDIPEPARQVNIQLQRLYGKSARFYALPLSYSPLSKWRLIASAPLAEHLDLLSAANLIELPASFYRPYYRQDKASAQHLLCPLDTMSLIDMADIQAVITQYPNLTRQGFYSSESPNKKALNHDNNPTAGKQHNPDELLNSIYADDWQVILQPEQFETGVGSLSTDIMACSVAVHALKQCSTRKTINSNYSAEQICQYVRSYLLSQLRLNPAQSYQYRQIRLFSGHIIVAALHLGWDIQQSYDGACYFNISSRCDLLARYPNMQDYYINGWSS